MEYKQFLNEILDKPSKANQCYKLFYNYSILNQWHAACQMDNLEPINTYKRWQELGRQVKKGAKAIALKMPVVITDKNKLDKNGEAEKKTIFVEKRNWFKLSDTEGQEYKEIEAPKNFNLDNVFRELGILKESFQMLNGNCQGYAKPAKKTIAINPLASDPFKTTLHEIAHCLLHNDEALMQHGGDLPKSIEELEAEGTAYVVKTSLGIYTGLEFSRDYIKSWLGGEEIKETNFKRILSAANKILTAGTKNLNLN